MATCRKMVEGGTVAFPCSLGLPEGHAGPCAADEKPASVAKRQKWLSEQMPEDSGYVEPRRAVELMIEPGSISKPPTGRQAEMTLPFPDLTPPPPPAPPQKADPTPDEIRRVIDLLLHRQSQHENWHTLLVVRQRLEAVVDQFAAGRVADAMQELGLVIASLPDDTSE